MIRAFLPVEKELSLSKCPGIKLGFHLQISFYPGIIPMGTLPGQVLAVPKTFGKAQCFPCHGKSCSLCVSVPFKPSRREPWAGQSLGTALEKVQGIISLQLGKGPGLILWDSLGFPLWAAAAPRAQQNPECPNSGEPQIPGLNSADFWQNSA